MVAPSSSPEDRSEPRPFNPTDRRSVQRIYLAVGYFQAIAAVFQILAADHAIRYLPIGYIRSTLKDRTNAPRQAAEGAPSASLEILPAFHEALEGLRPGHENWILTWLHETDRETLKVHPRSDPRNPLTGVFATSSPDRPNPIGLHRARLLGIDNATLHVEAIETIDGTPILDIKPVLNGECGR